MLDRPVRVACPCCLGSGFVVARGTRRLRVNELIRIVAAKTGIPTSAIRGATRSREYLRCRDVVTRIACEEGHTLEHIGRVLGLRHHTTIMTGRNRAARLFDTDPDFRKLCDNVRGAALTALTGEDR